MKNEDDDFIKGSFAGGFIVLIVLAAFGLIFNSSCSVRIKIGTDKSKIEVSKQK